MYMKEHPSHAQKSSARKASLPLQKSLRPPGMSGRQNSSFAQQFGVSFSRARRLLYYIKHNSSCSPPLPGLFFFHSFNFLSRVAASFFFFISTQLLFFPSTEVRQKKPGKN